jgi:hypothetical protein
VQAGREGDLQHEVLRWFHVRLSNDVSSNANVSSKVMFHPTTFCLKLTKPNLT